MDEDKLKMILGGSVDDGVAGLGKLKRDDLTKLHELESGGKKRSTMLSAIDAAIKALPADDAGQTGSGDGGASPSLLQRVVGAVSGGVGATDGAQGGGETAAAFTQAQVDQLLADQRASQSKEFDTALAERDAFHQAEKERAVAEAKGTTAAAVTIDAPGALAIASGADNPSLAALSSVSSIVFVDDHDRPLSGLPTMTFTAADFEPVGSAVALKVEVEFPKEIPATEVAGAFLLDDEDDPVGKAALVMPFGIGGGKATRLAKSTLHFAA